MTPKKSEIFEKFDQNPISTDLNVKLVKQREIEMVSDGNKTNGVKDSQMITLNLKDLWKNIFSKKIPWKKVIYKESITITYTSEIQKIPLMKFL